jgi:hypothetical protein
MRTRVNLVCVLLSFMFLLGVSSVGCSPKESVSSSSGAVADAAAPEQVDGPEAAPAPIWPSGLGAAHQTARYTTIDKAGIEGAVQTAGYDSAYLAVGADDTVYQSADRRVFATDPSSNEVIWETELGADVKAGPCLDDAGNIYAAISLNGKHSVVRLSPSGRLEWSVAVNGPDLYPNPTDRAWIQALPSGGAVYCASNRTVSVDADGKVVWDHGMPEEVPREGELLVSSIAVADDGTAFVYYFANGAVWDMGCFRVIGPSGEVRSETIYNMQTEEDRLMDLREYLSMAAVSGTTLYTYSGSPANGGSGVLAIGFDGKRKWFVKSGFTDLAVVEEGVLVVAGPKITLYGESGKQIREFEAPGEIGQLTVCSDGSIVFYIRSSKGDEVWSLDSQLQTQWSYAAAESDAAVAGGGRIIPGRGYFLRVQGKSWVRAEVAPNGD